VSTLALVTGPADVAALRLAVGLVAGGHELRLALAGAGRLDGEACADYLEGLAQFGVHPETLDAAGLRAALEACGRIVRLADPARAGEPAVLEVSDAWLARTTDDALLDTLAAAGQVIRL
jgi:hypothetical protein